MGDTMEDRFTPLKCVSDDGASIELCRHGGQLLSWVPSGGTEALFTSSRAVFAEGAAIRGGVPVIFPQFASRGSLPKHGFARTSAFVVRSAARGDDGEARVELELVDDAETRSVWPHSFALTQRITASGDSLRQELRLKNTGHAPFSVTAAFHGYFAVQDARTVRLEGLDGVAFEEFATDPSLETTPRFDRECDRVYASTPRVRIVDATRSLELTCEGFREWVVWNPGDALAAKLADLGVEDGRRFVCVEPAIVRVPVSVPAGGSWAAAQTVRSIPHGSTSS